MECSNEEGGGQLLKGCIISICGLDGAGKTTVSKRVVSALRQNWGIRAHYAWPKFGLMLRGAGRRQHGRGAAVLTSIKLPSRHGGKEFTFVLYFLLHVLRTVRQVWIPAFRKRVVLVDRGFGDTYSDLVTDWDLSSSSSRFLCKFLIPSWISRRCIYLRISPELAFSRKGDSKSIRYLERRKASYDQLNAVFDAVSIDGTLPLEEVVEAVVDIIRNNLREGCDGL